MEIIYLKYNMVSLIYPKGMDTYNKSNMHCNVVQEIVCEALCNSAPWVTSILVGVEMAQMVKAFV